MPYANKSDGINSPQLYIDCQLFVSINQMSRILHAIGYLLYRKSRDLSMGNAIQGKNPKHKTYFIDIEWELL